jgi:hypothetical protein
VVVNILTTINDWRRRIADLIPDQQISAVAFGQLCPRFL